MGECQLTRREFLKGAAGFALVCGAGFGVSGLAKLFRPAPENAVGPLLADGLELLPLSDGAEVSYQGVTCFTVNDAGARLLRLANGRNTLEEIVARTGMESQAGAVADFYITLGKAGYLRNRVEVNKIAVEV